MTRTTIRWDRISALLVTFTLGTFVGRSNGLPWYATAALAGVCVVGAWSVMWS